MKRKLFLLTVSMIASAGIASAGDAAALNRVPLRIVRVPARIECAAIAPAASDTGTLPNFTLRHSPVGPARRRGLHAPCRVGKLPQAVSGPG